MRLIQMTWTGVKGAARFVEAIATGDVASPEEIDRRRAICRDCPSKVIKMIPGGIVGIDGDSAWCGEPLVENDWTCGCLLAGKTAVGSEFCPQGKWDSVNPPTRLSPDGEEGTRSG